MLLQGFSNHHEHSKRDGISNAGRGQEPLCCGKPLTDVQAVAGLLSKAPDKEKITDSPEKASGFV